MLHGRLDHRPHAARAFIPGLLGLVGASWLSPVAAWDFELSSLNLKGKLQGQASFGMGVRTERQSSTLIGKLNLPGQEQFCEDKPQNNPPGRDCTTVAGNAAYLALPGAASSNNDNGDLNYNKGDLFATVFRLAPRLQFTHDLFGVDLSALAYYDPVNYQFDEYHPNNIEDNNGFQPRHTRRPKGASNQIGLGVKLLDAFVSTDVPIPGDRELSIKLGNQLLSLGTTTTMVLNGLNVINPPDVNARFAPGSDNRDVFERVPLAVFNTSLNQSLSATAFYQFQWKPVTLPPIGSYYSSNDVIGEGDPYIGLLFGKNREDPNNVVGTEGRTQGNAGLLSNAGRTIYLAPERDPHNSGQYGLSLSYLASWLNNTTFELDYLNLHARFPNVSFIASDKGCADDANGAAAPAEALATCRGFATTPVGVEPLPLDTVKAFIDYPENIQTFGFSFSTNLGSVSWTGEVAYRPNQPLQIDVIDLGFAALHPVFPAQSINFGVVTLPGEQVATPDYVETVYRHNPNVTPHQIIRGYERFQTLNYNSSLLFLFGASENPFGADQVTLLTEIGGMQVLDLPSLDQLQITSVGTQFHHSAGVDGTGTANAQQQQSPANVRLNPTYQADGFATSFSYGYRLLGQLNYENVFPNVRISPQFSFFHDVGGRSPQPLAEFVAGRKQATFGINSVINNSFATTLRYSWYFGGGARNQLSDRDNVQLSFSYDF